MATVSPDEQPYRLPAVYTPGRIGIVTVTYNSSEVMPEFLTSLERQSYKDFVLYAVDNASKDDSVPQLQRWHDPRLVLIANSDNIGVAGGNNQGIRAAIRDGCEYLLLLNNDVVFSPELIRNLLNGLAEHRCAMATPLIYFHEPSDVIWCAGGYFQPKLGYRNLHYGENERDEGQFNQARAVSYAPTCCVLIQREVFARIGLMDERYFVYSDDTDFMLRAAEANLLLYYVPEARLWHKVNSLTGAESPFSMYYGARNRAFFISKHVGKVYAAVFNILYPVYYLLRFLAMEDSHAAYRIKRTAWAEGIKMSALGKSKL